MLSKLKLNPRGSPRSVGRGSVISINEEGLLKAGSGLITEVVEAGSREAESSAEASCHKTGWWSCGWEWLQL